MLTAAWSLVAAIALLWPGRVLGMFDGAPLSGAAEAIVIGLVVPALWWFDRTIVDGTVNGVGALTRGAGGGLRQVQTGRVQNYALGIAIGLIVMAGSFLVIAGR